MFIAAGATDMRKSINGLSLIVEEEFELDLFSESLFAFCNRRKDMVKILYWSGNGFCIWMKRLEQDVFCWPDTEQDVIEINQSALQWLLSGLDIRQAHRQLEYNSVS
ncbi:transposase [Desulfomarina profundi]|uniref:Transposase n=1 Tax=Desulfomarina profundi TaxID=2772557 RepID=A0A8D5FX61_9BACT|nr:IS66 family insertion sequence element accessory protein TnpB [Desulfomarina profundi]BCL61592.1 transposase [Desulfomarina profundi]